MNFQDVRIQFCSRVRTLLRGEFSYKRSLEMRDHRRSSRSCLWLNLARDSRLLKTSTNGVDIK